ncbi:MAG: hypothetical protein ABJZ55_04910 [Fuerstiella sp.]
MLDQHTSVKLVLLLAIFSGSTAAGDEFFSDFTSLQGWEDDSTGGSLKSYEIVDKENGRLKMSTRAKTKDRVKVKTKGRFSAGEYHWRVFVPEMGIGDQASIGAFLFQDNKHELDFEIGYGTSELRKKLGANEDELVCYLTSQGFPASSSQVLIRRNDWYKCTIKISAKDGGKFLVEWFLNNVRVKTLQTQFSDETNFTAHCSLENLAFLGDHSPSQENYAIFDYFKFSKASNK